MNVSSPASTSSEASGLYTPAWYRIGEEALSELRALTPHKPVVAAVVTWIEIVALVKLYLYLNHWWLYPFFAFFIAGRAGVFLQLAHEAAHGLISRGYFNDWFGRWIAAAPLGLDFQGYKDPHMWHHACTNASCDPVSDREKYKFCDIRNPKLWLYFVKDALGITAILIHFLYDRPEINKTTVGPDETEIPFNPTTPVHEFRDVLIKWGPILAAQGLIFLALFQGSIPHYLLLWVLPLITAHMVLMRVRGIGEHGLGVQLRVHGLDSDNKGLFYTRSFGTPVNVYSFLPLAWLERALIGSLNVYYHHEHHLYPKIPYYNLPKLHALIAERAQRRNPYLYAKGYFTCLFFNLLHPQAQPVI